MILPAITQSKKFVVASNTVSQIVGKVVGAVTTFVVSLYIAKQYGAAGYGDFIKVTTFVALFYLLVDFGLNAIYLQKKHEWSTLLGLRISGSIAVSFLALIILVFLPQSQTNGYTNVVRFGILLFLPTIFFQGLITSANAIFQQRLRYDFSMFALVFGNTVTILLLFFLPKQISTSVGLTMSLAILLVGIAITGLVSLWYVRRLGIAITVDISVKRWREFLWAAFPLGLTIFFNLIYIRADSIILTLTRSTAEVGIYGLAYKVFELPLVIATFFMNAVYPLMVNKTNIKITKEFLSIVRQSGIVLLILSLLILLILWFLAPYIATIHPEFLSSIAPLRVLSLSFPFFFLTSLSMWTLIACRRQNMLIGIYGGAMIVNIFFNIWLVPLFGYMAAAWVTVGSEALVLVASGFVLQQAFTKPVLFSKDS